MSSDSDEEVGRGIDYSDDEKPLIPKPKREVKAKREVKPKKEPKPLPQVPQVEQEPIQVTGRLTSVQRQQIIDKFNQGIDDPGYHCVKLATGAYRVNKRKATTRSVKAEPTPEIHTTWMNLQTEMNERLHKDLKRLRKRYEILADQYESSYSVPEITPAPPTPEIKKKIETKSDAPPHPYPPVTISLPKNRKKAFMTYTSRNPFNVKDY
jgi:hypothetical protein